MVSKYQKHIDVAREEIIKKEFGTTQQYLWVHEVIFEDDQPKVERIDDETYKGNIIAIYFPIKNVNFYLEIHVLKNPISVDSVWIESGHKIYLTATSEMLTYEELVEWLNIEPLEWFSKWDSRIHLKSKYTFSEVTYNPIKNQAYSLNAKLDKLLNELEKAKDAIRILKEKSDYIGISVCKYQYIWNWMMGDNLSANEIKRLADLNLAIDFDIYIQGIPFWNQ
ncbi:MAG: hypothetical protein ACD_2C00014G0010 [uncultured bacterium (gcode 4)]|uniref:DUF4279 domain-containing protein n=1 Tax=uncultured bacterium (gcode 4) TaxID=1234023 RepID=K2FGL6_9BACT|nr:MAG: hypothetical protein ACD_2C00014G0010 [uncultured bacterium (gcode 4)]